MDTSVIKSYLVELGFKVDNRQLNMFNEGMKKAARIAGDEIGNITKGFLVAGSTITGVLASIAAGTVGMMGHVADADLDMQVFARRMYLGVDAARKMKTATDALGYSIEEIVWGPPELAERYRQLIHDQNKMLAALGGTDFEKQMRHLRDIRFEFTRFGVEMKYFSMILVKDLSKALFGDSDALLNKLQKFNEWFMDNMPRIAQTIAIKVSPSFRELGKALGHLFESLSRVDWASLMNSVVKITEKLVKLLDYIVSHPTLAKILLGTVAGGAAGSVLPGIGTGIGALAGGGIAAADSGLDAIVRMRHPKAAQQSTQDFYAGLGLQNFSGPVFKNLIKQRIVAAAKANGVDPALALAVAAQESGFNPNAVNKSTGASGLFQLMPGTAKTLGVTNTFDPSQNISAGVRYLSDLLRKYNGDVGAALKEYGGFVKTDPSDYINSVNRYRKQFATVQPTSMHSTVHVGDIYINQPNATPEEIHRAVAKAVSDKTKSQNLVLLAQRQGVFA